jgi:hypothetical protein
MNANRISFLLLLAPVLALAQGRGGRGGPPPTPKAGAPIDITGYWVSLITEDWRYRMQTPPRGDFPSIPVNAEGRRIALAWDPAKENPADACKSYGAGNIMRTPGRIHITWDNDTTLKLEMDNGEQTRLFHFGNAAEDHGQYPTSGAPTWQGDSTAQWELAGAGGRGGGSPAQRGGDLLVVTTHMKPGYLQKNGVPYSSDAIITEHFDLTKEPNGDQMLIVTTLVDDPMYLARHFQRSSHFKKQADATGWDPTPCTVK